MNRLTPELKEFIERHADSDPSEIALLAKRYPNWPMVWVAQQIKGRQRIRIKLPSWHARSDIVYPAGLSLEQCTSEQVASYRAGLLQGETIADLTGGFGVDAMAFAERFKWVYHIERDAELSEIAAANARALGKEAGVTMIAGDGMEWLAARSGALDAIFVDPARRDRRALKVSALEECEPNLIEVWSDLLAKAPLVAAKVSPGYDVDALVDALGCIREIHAISIGDECKELFCVAESNWGEEPRIVCASQEANGSWNRFAFRRSDEKHAEGRFEEYSRYLYEPNASVRKAGAYKCFGREWDLPLLHPRTRFYTSKRLIEGFPGRIFEVVDSGELRASGAARLFPDRQANALARNAGMDTAALKKKLKLADGGEWFAIGTTDRSEKRHLLKCRRIVR